MERKVQTRRLPLIELNNQGIRINITLDNAARIAGAVIDNWDIIKREGKSLVQSLERAFKVQS